MFLLICCFAYSCKVRYCRGWLSVSGAPFDRVLNAFTVISCYLSVFSRCRYTLGWLYE